MTVVTIEQDDGSVFVYDTPIVDMSISYDHFEYPTIQLTLHGARGTLTRPQEPKTLEDVVRLDAEVRRKDLVDKFSSIFKNTVGIRPKDVTVILGDGITPTYYKTEGLTFYLKDSSLVLSAKKGTQVYGSVLIVRAADLEPYL